MLCCANIVTSIGRITVCANGRVHAGVYSVSARPLFATQKFARSPTLFLPILRSCFAISANTPSEMLPRCSGVASQACEKSRRSYGLACKGHLLASVVLGLTHLTIGPSAADKEVLTTLSTPLNNDIVKRLQLIYNSSSLILFYSATRTPKNSLHSLSASNITIC